MKKQPVNNFLPVTLLAESLPSILSLPLVGDRLCLDFINTIDWRLTPAKRRDALLSYSELLAFALRSNGISSEQYGELSRRALLAPHEAEAAFIEARSFRDSLTALIDAMAGSPSSPPRPDPIEAALAALRLVHEKSRQSERLQWREGCLSLAANPEAEGLDYPWLVIVRDAVQLLSSPEASRLRICAAEGCGRAYLDSSKNGSRRWCSMKLCGNRAKSERFRSRGFGQ
jgi:predicted RNA-binding Zn ribbon-like protein